MNAIREVMGGVSSVMILGHVRPDGDCVGSCLGLRAYLRANYPEAETDVYLDPFADSLFFLEGTDSLNPERPEEKPYDIAFVLDSADRERIGAGKERLRYAKTVVCIDHHISNSGYGDINVIKPDYSSASEVIYSLLEEERMTRAAAECLYTGIIHDTGVFQYSNVSRLTLERAGKLIDFGFDYSDIISRSFHEKTLSHLWLLGYALEHSQYTSDGNGVWSCVTLADMERFSSSPMETEGIAENLRNTRGIDYSILLYETEPGCFKASLRSKKKTDVSRVASAFGGGGHKRAAGCSFNGKLPEEMIRLLVAKAAEAAEPDAGTE